jgi:protein subunit release factor A
MEPQFIEKLTEIERTYKELEERLSSPEVLSDQSLAKRLGKTRRSLEQIVDAYHSWQGVQQELEGAQEILRGESDKEIREMAESALKNWLSVCASSYCPKIRTTTKTYWLKFELVPAAMKPLFSPATY